MSCNSTCTKDKNTDRIYFPELDGLRFFAFVLVFIHHNSLFSMIPYLSFLNTYGWIGVDLFFTLSAYLFTKLLITEYDKTNTINFKKFYARRIFRIWPIYFLFIGFSIILQLLFFDGISKYIQLRVFGLFALSDNIMTAIFGYNSLPFSSHLWTIAYEEQFYIFIPIIIVFLVRSTNKMKLIFFLAILVLFNLSRFILISQNVPYTALWVLPVTHFESIILGIVIGFGGFDFLLKKLKPLTIGLLGIIFFILLGVLPAIEDVSFWLIIAYTVIGISTSLVLFSVLNSEYLKRFFSIKTFVFLGKRSYGLYVYHLLGNAVGTYSVSLIPELPYKSLFSCIFSLAFTIIVSIASYKIIETPFLKLKKRFEVIISRPI